MKDFDERCWRWGCEFESQGSTINGRCSNLKSWYWNSATFASHQSFSFIYLNLMKEYIKIQTVYKRDERTKKIIQGDYSIPEFQTLENASWVWTEKVDGTNIRIMWDGESVVFGGKTDNAQIPVQLLYELQRLFEGTANKQKFKEVFTNSTEVCLYGEGYGSKIQAAGKMYNPEGHNFVLFDVKIGNFWLERNNVEDIAAKLGIQIVPIVGEGTLIEAVEKVQQGMKSQWGDFTSEGLVLRPKTELFTRKGERIITKIKHKDFN